MSTLYTVSNDNWFFYGGNYGNADSVKCVRVCVLALIGGAPAICCADAPRAPEGATCSSDRDCASAFCDLGRCEELGSGIYAYGLECRSLGPSYNSGPIGFSGIENGKYSTCAGYLCINERCHSCTSAAQCYDAIGAPSCYANEGRPGQACGRQAPPGAEVYEPPAVDPQQGRPVAAVEQEPGLPSTLRLTTIGASSSVSGAHLLVLWWHQRIGEPDEFMGIAYDLAIDSSAPEFVIPFSALSLPTEENLLCFRPCRDRSVCACDSRFERFAIGSIMVVIDENGDGNVSLDEARAEQIGGSTTVVGWSPTTVTTADTLLFESLYQGFAAYAPDESLQTLLPTTSVAAAISFCEPGNASCSFAVPEIVCNSTSCARDGELNRFGL